MASTMSIASTGLVALVSLLSLLPTVVADFPMAYCSSQNTGSTEAAFWTWQSNGWCIDNCKSEYAFAVLNEKNCWCSNYIPADQEDTSDCDMTCPGFKTEFCGSNSAKRYVYIAVEGMTPSGTQGASKPTSAKVSSSPTPSPTPSEEPSPEPTSTEANTSDEPSSATPNPTTLQTSASASSAEPVTSNRLITISGGVITQTIVITPTFTPAATSAPAVTEKENSGTNVGAIAGGVVGGVVGLAAIVGGIFFILWRRRRRNQEEEDPDHQSGINRNTSTMSKAGLIRSEKTPQYPPQITTSFGSGNKRSSRMMQDNESISPVSGSDRRSSRPYIFDQRLNPSAIMNLENTSRGSFASMDDSRDYGRTLNVRNPDPQRE